ncbi:MAG: glutamate 5-kinase, partial [Planctomycetaceae bacterium]|nr:glutamate 5-kinase [Planctomycetaceae bacterium]
MPDPLRQDVADVARLLVVKVGTRVLTGADGLLDHDRIEALGRQFDTLLASGRSIVLVSSGAVGAGMGRMGLSSRPQELAHLQAVAAIGQSCLIEAYERVFRSRGRHAAQVLLVADDLQDRARYLNIRNTLRALLDYGVIPVINENDTVSVEELRTSFGDNDRLAALVATLLGAPLLVLLSDVDGLFDRHPSDPAARKIDTVEKLDAGVDGLARDTLGGLSKGGMTSKIKAARIATEAGGHCIIASGRDDDVLNRIVAADTVGTLFVGRGTAMPAWKRWLGWSADARGRLIVDDGARGAVVSQGRSLLAAGIRAVEGTFTAGEVVSLVAADGEFARGLANYPADDLRQIAGLKTEQITGILGYCPYDEVIH